jgi:osmotically-inducible protein OsmY
MKTLLLPFLALTLVLSTVSCTQRAKNVSYKDGVKKALEQADYKDVTVDEDSNKNTITLGGKLHSENAKQQASEVAQSASGGRTIVNQISVEPVGVESEARKIESNTDDAIEKNYKAQLIAKGLDKQDIRFDAKNGVLTLKGSVKDVRQREVAEQVASSVPNVAQVVNQIEVSR